MSKTVIFDFDGVLWDSEYIYVGAIIRILEHNNMPINKEEAFSLFSGVSIKTKSAIMQEKFAIDIATAEAVAIRKSAEKELEQNNKPTKRIEEVFRFLQNNKINMCIASGSSKKAILRRLAEWGLDSYFDPKTIFSSIEIEALGGKGKPEPDVFLYAAQKMGASPKDCIVVEDSKAGITAGIRANMTVVAYMEHQILREEILSQFGQQVIPALNADELLHKLKGEPSSL